MQSTPNPSRVRFTGPLAPFAPGLVDEFARLGYPASTATAKMQFAAHLSRWLAECGSGPAELTGPVVDRFLIARRAGYSNYVGVGAVRPILEYLQRVGAAPVSAVEPPASPAEALLARFGGYLTGERALTVPVAQAYCHWVRPFVADVLWRGDIDRCGELSAGEVTRFLAARLPGLSRKSAQMTGCALRSLLRFLHCEGIVEVGLADTVPSVAYWKGAGLVRPLDAGQVRALLGACDPSDPVGRRDLAVITLMCRMGLRCGEVAGLRLEDIDWARGVVTVHGKGNRTDRLPLPVDVGQAVVDYLRGGRPATSARAVFVRAKAPYTALVNSGVSCIVARAARRAGLGTVHGHRLRHTAASLTLNAGAGLEQVAELLRHTSPVTTFGYAKIDQKRLALVARPWPTMGETR